MAPICIDPESQKTLRRRADDAVRVLREGGVVAIPTDTVYGLAAACDDDEAIDRIFHIKGRSARVAMPLLLHDAASIHNYVSSVPHTLWALAEAFWPGPLTLVVPKNGEVSSRLTAGGDTVGLRVPDHWVPRYIVESLGKAITGTSANISGSPSLMTAEAVEASLGHVVDLVVNGGPANQPAASTVVDLTGENWKIIRHGRVSLEMIEQALSADLALR
jgi:L-threonylcarbamoyladenylate synthase